MLSQDWEQSSTTAVLLRAHGGFLGRANQVSSLLLCLEASLLLGCLTKILRPPPLCLCCFLQFRSEYVMWHCVARTAGLRAQFCTAAHIWLFLDDCSYLFQDATHIWYQCELTSVLETRALAEDVASIFASKCFACLCQHISFPVYIFLPVRDWTEASAQAPRCFMTFFPLLCPFVPHANAAQPCCCLGAKIMSNVSDQWCRVWLLSWQYWWNLIVVFM